jgi:hypothetical protein
MGRARSLSKGLLPGLAVELTVSVDDHHELIGPPGADVLDPVRPADIVDENGPALRPSWTICARHSSRAGDARPVSNTPAGHKA